MPQTNDTGGCGHPLLDGLETVFVTAPAEGVYVFHTREEQEYVRSDHVVDLSSMR